MANILVVGPHPDDQELGMGGTIACLAEQGHDVLLLDMTDGEPTPYGNPATRAKEAQAALAALSPDPTEFPGARPVRRVQLGLRNRYVEHTIEARHMVAGVIRAHRAEILFVPYFEDAHPDHRAVTRIVEDARFDAKLTGLEMPTPEGLTPGAPCHPRWLFHYYCTHLRITPQPTFVFDVSGCEAKKEAAIRAYHSQFGVNEKNRPVVDWVMSATRFFGSRIGTAAGEPFFAREPVGMTGLASLPL
ncbi:MAG: PIG-L family deacetylase [Phycisphaerales bacterium]|nr:PIG-L family deacetylase [Phycisphaerales bacterium]